jgi:hypothetical protein
VKNSRSMAMRKRSVMAPAAGSSRATCSHCFPVCDIPLHRAAFRVTKRRP